MLLPDVKLNMWAIPIVRRARYSAKDSVLAAGTPMGSIGNLSIGPRLLTVRSWQPELLGLAQGASIRLNGSTLPMKRQVCVVAGSPARTRMFW